MFRSIWQSLRETVYDFATSLFRSQEDIDIIIENEILDAGYAILYDEEPDNASMRKHTFSTHKDALEYASVIPAQCVTVVAWTGDNGNEKGDTIYEVWVSENS